ncbi:MAG: hypothetical protein DIU78_001665 [Pseudomonadota bacterium]
MQYPPPPSARDALRTGPRTRSALDVSATGVGIGVVAGVLFLVAEIVIGAARASPLSPFRFAASLSVGMPALVQMPSGAAVLLGGLTHLLLSSIYGFVFAWLNENASAGVQGAFGRQTALGALFGLVLWLVNFQMIARALFPWFLEVPPLAQALAHVFAFGLPLGALYAAATRRQHHVRRLQTAARNDSGATLH